MKKQQKITIGDSNIVSLRYPKIKMKNVKNFGKSYTNTMKKAILGKRLTYNQSQQLLWIHLIAEDFPILPKLIILQLIDTYEERLAYFVEKESFENASEFRDIIISLRNEMV
jgi:protein-arginine kinase activator protein McsA